MNFEARKWMKSRLGVMFNYWFLHAKEIILMQGSVQLILKRQYCEKDGQMIECLHRNMAFTFLWGPFAISESQNPDIGHLYVVQKHPTDPFATLTPLNQAIGVFEVRKACRSMNFDARKWMKSRLGVMFNYWFLHAKEFFFMQQGSVQLILKRKYCEKDGQMIECLHRNMAFTFRWGPFAISEPQNPDIGHLYVVQKHPNDPFTTMSPLIDVSELHKICQYPDFEALKLWKGRSGMVRQMLKLQICEKVGRVGHRPGLKCNKDEMPGFSV